MSSPSSPKPTARGRSTRSKVGWVFAGGGARGAYEVGACLYIFDRVARELGRALPIDIVSGTSVGALHASALAAGADDPQAAMKNLAARWTSLSLGDVLLIDKRRAFNMIRALFGHPPRHPTADAARGGILDPKPLERLLSSAMDFRRIDDHIAAGRLTAVSLSTTHVDTGMTTVFYQCAHSEPSLQPQARTRVRRVKLTAAHAIASAAIPFLFPAVPVEGELYCDGSLRQHVPLSPARQLGADAIVVVNPRSPPTSGHGSGSEYGEHAFPGPLFLLGKTLNALTFDRIDGDIEQLDRTNRLLAAGIRRFGPTFVSQLNQALAEDGGPPATPISLLHLQASEDIGRLSAAFVRSRRFRAGRPAQLTRAFCRLADSEGNTEADLLSYVLFDSRFTHELVDLGWRDAERRHDEIVTFFAAILDERGQEVTNDLPQPTHSER